MLDPSGHTAVDEARVARLPNRARAAPLRRDESLDHHIGIGQEVKRLHGRDLVLEVEFDNFSPRPAADFRFFRRRHDRTSRSPRPYRLASCRQTARVRCRKTPRCGIPRAGRRTAELIYQARCCLLMLLIASIRRTEARFLQQDFATRTSSRGFRAVHGAMGRMPYAYLRLSRCPC
jgi:hypothetical protein